MKTSQPIRPNNIYFAILSVAAALAIIGCFFYLFQSRPKIAYVRNMELVYGFNGMKQAHAEYKAQTNMWQSNIDTLRMRYQKSLTLYQQDYKSFTSKEREERETILQRLQDDLNKYTKAVQDQAKEHEAKLTEGVLNQVSSYVQKYGKEKGYDIILGSEGAGTILYGTDAYDITAEVLEVLNKEYKIMPEGNSNVNP